jgi:hypothetical protein
LKSSAARVQTVPSIHAQRQAHGRVVRSSPGGLDQTEPQMLYLIYPQPYGSELSVDVKCGFSIRPTRANGQHRCLLHLRAVADDTESRTNKKHCRCKPDKCHRGASLAAGNTQSILVAQKNRKCRLLRQRNELQLVSLEGEAVGARLSESGRCCCACSARCSSQSIRFLARPVFSALIYCFPNGDLASSCWKPK